jgi:hypothetical protein
MPVCTITPDQQLSVLLTQLEVGLGICLAQDRQESSLGVSISSFYHEDSDAEQLKLVGFTDCWFPEEFDLHFTGSDKQCRLFCAIVDNWPGNVLKRSEWYC